MLDETITVLVVQATASFSDQLRDALEGDRRIHIVEAQAHLAYLVGEIGRVSPNLIILEADDNDLQMLDAIESVMAYKPTPILVLSDTQRSPLAQRRIAAFKQRGALATMALSDAHDNPEAFVQNLLLLASVPVVRHLQAARRAGWHPDAPVFTPLGANVARTMVPTIALVASTGGPQALATILSSLSPDLPAAVVIVQHLAEGFAEHLVSWLDHVCPLDVALARPSAILSAGQVRVAPNDKHLIINPQLQWTLSDSPTYLGHRPSATVLLNSVAAVCGQNAVGVVLSGMGEDGAAGLLALRHAGGHTLSQNEATSVVYGMAKRSMEMGAVQREVPLEGLAREITRLAHQLKHAQDLPR